MLKLFQCILTYLHKIVNSLRFALVLVWWHIIGGFQLHSRWLNKKTSKLLFSFKNIKSNISLKDKEASFYLINPQFSIFEIFWWKDCLVFTNNFHEMLKKNFMNEKIINNIFYAIIIKHFMTQLLITNLLSDKDSKILVVLFIQGINISLSILEWC